MNNVPFLPSEHKILRHVTVRKEQRIQRAVDDYTDVVTVNHHQNFIVVIAEIVWRVVGLHKKKN